MSTYRELKIAERHRNPESGDPVNPELWGNESGLKNVARCYVYILASRLGGTLYIGLTTDLAGRVCAHKLEAVEGFTKKYKVNRLVYFETFDDLAAAALREKQMKKWKRSWKVGLIEERNPNWIDLYPRIATQ